MRSKGFFMLFLALALLLSAVPAAAVTDKVAWMSSSDMIKWSVKIMNLDGSNQQNLSRVSDPTGQYSDRDPHFKPNGTKILFTSTRGGAIERLYTMDPDGNNVAGLSPAGAAYSASTGKFSWDGARVVFKKVQAGIGSLVFFQVTDPAGTLTGIPNTGSADLWPAWSPDAQWVVFQRDVGSQHLRIYKIHPDGTGLTPLTDGLHLDEMPYYSPDGQYIVFKRNASPTEPPDIYRMNAADGTGITNLTNTPALTEDAPTYSWDGKLIAYMGASTGPFTARIYTANTDGSGRKALTDDNLANFNPTFAPPTRIGGGAADSLLLLLDD
jgi:Tol biopolymer transport system component